MKKAFRPWDSLRWWSVAFWRCLVREEYQSMRSAPRALVPSHPLHVMPSRITRNSHRPRASDRTMVASEATGSLVALSNSMACHHQQRNSREWTTSQTSPEKCNYSGLDLEKESPLRSRRSFFLTSLFIELIERVMSVIAVCGSVLHESTLQKVGRHSFQPRKRSAELE